MLASVGATPMLRSLPPPAADYNLRVLWTIAKYIEDKRGVDGLREIAEAGGVAVSEFGEKNAWVSSAAFEAMLAKARQLMADDEEFKRAAAYRIREAYGPLRYLLWALTPAQVYIQSATQLPVVTRAGSITVVDHGPTHAHLRFEARGQFSRLNCLVRHAQGEALPTLWGLPPAHLREDKCIALGDPTCELHFTWYSPRRWLPVLIGAATAGLIGWVLGRFAQQPIPAWALFALVGGAIGYLFEVRRTERVNEHTREGFMDALRQLAHGESDARRELLEMHRRQSDWTRLVEEEMTARAAAIQGAVAGVQEVQKDRASTLLGFSHDLRNPLQIIQMSAEYLESIGTLKADPDATESLNDIHQAVERMRLMLGELVQVTKAQRDFVKLAPQHVEIAGLTDGLRRRLQALVHGRDVRSTVFATREAPDAIEVDPLAFDRILDNLLTNAAKYTERGSIVVELDGTSGYLVIKVSDTGCGIAPESLDRIFEPGGSSVGSRRGDSFGVGLSVVVQLLDQIGGRLEVMSRPGSGTTFWVNFPLTAAASRRTIPEAAPASAVRSVSPSIAPANRQGGALSRVVTIRRLPA